MPIPIGTLLVEENLITADQLELAQRHQRRNGGRLGSILIKLGFVQDDVVTALLSKKYGVPSVNPAFFEIDPSVIELISADIAQKYRVVPVRRSGSTITVASEDPANVYAMDDIKFMTGFNVVPVVASEASITRALEKYYGTPHSIELEKVYEQIARSHGENVELNPDQSAEESEAYRCSVRAKRLRSLNWST